MINTGSPVNEFIKSFFSQLEDGLKEVGYSTCPENESHVKLDLNALASNEVSGTGNAKILGIGGSVEGNMANTNSHKVTVFVKKLNDLEKEKEKAAIEKAKIEQTFARQIALK